MNAPMLTLVPPPEPPPPLEGLPLEDAARAELTRMMGMDVQVSAPTWRQVLFSGKRIKFQVPRAPQGAIDTLSQIKPPEDTPKDNVGITAVGLAERLQKDRPEGLVPRSLTAMPPLPASRDAVASWLRTVFLVTAGPACLPLLVASGYLLPQDVATLEELYPEGLEAQRKASVEAAMAVTAAGHRTGHSAELPGWLNDQLMTLMDEESPAGFFQEIYDSTPNPEQAPGSSTLGGNSTRLANQMAPDTLHGDVT